MPPACVATTTQDQTCSRRCSGRKTAKRAASVPPGKRENSGLVESSRSKKQRFSLLDVEDVPSSSLSSAVTMVTARGHKRALSRATSQEDCMASTAEQGVEDSERRPRKRHKRSSSTPPAPKSCQLSTQLQSYRRSRPRAGSPTTDVEHVLRSRLSARVLRKIHPLIDRRSSDIYTHLADPDGAGDLLNELPASSVTLSTLNMIGDSQSLKRTRRRQGKIADLSDENAKRDLMKEWAQMRQFQCSLPFSGINGDACSNQTLLHVNRKGNRPVSSTQPEVPTRRKFPDADLESQTSTIINIPQSQDTILDDSLQGSSLTRTDFENILPAGIDSSRETGDHKDAVDPSDGGTEQPIIPDLGIETPSTPIHMVEESTTGQPPSDSECVHHSDLLQYPKLPSPSLSPAPSRGHAVHYQNTKSTRSLINEQSGAVGHISPEDGHPVPLPQTCHFDTGSIHLDSDEEFFMLDIPEVFTLPWVPLSRHLYVPPGLGKLISGMREQLVIEARARRRAEELYQSELSRRISAESVIEGLRTELEGKREDLSVED